LRNSGVSLTIAPSPTGSALGFLYLDDGETHKYKENDEQTVIKYEYKNNVLQATLMKNKYKSENYYNKIMLLGITHKPSKVSFTVKNKEKYENLDIEIFDFDEKMNAIFVLLFDNQASVMQEFKFNIEF